MYTGIPKRNAQSQRKKKNSYKGVTQHSINNFTTRKKTCVDCKHNFYSRATKEDMYSFFTGRVTVFNSPKLWLNEGIFDNGRGVVHENSCLLPIIFGQNLKACLLNGLAKSVCRCQSMHELECLLCTQLLLPKVQYSEAG